MVHDDEMGGKVGLRMGYVRHAQNQGLELETEPGVKMFVNPFEG